LPCRQGLPEQQKDFNDMCELLGLAFNKPISPSRSFRGFRHRAVRNPVGRSLAAITPTKAQITKKPIRADQSDMSRALRDDPRLTAPIFIGHVRLASRSEVNLKNTHPFTRRINGSDFVFAHNGTLSMDQLNHQDAGHLPVEGSTDSELAMCVLLSWMAREQVATRQRGKNRPGRFRFGARNVSDRNKSFDAGHLPPDPPVATLLALGRARTISLSLQFELEAGGVACIRFLPLFARLHTGPRNWVSCSGNQRSATLLLRAFCGRACRVRPRMRIRT